MIGAAMREADRVGIGRVTLSRRERLVVVEPRDAGLVLITLRAAEEVRTPSFATADTAVDADMVAVALDDHQAPWGAFRPDDVPGPLSGGAARADRDEDERSSGHTETDRATAAGARCDGCSEAELGAGNRHGPEANTQSCQRSPARQSVAAGIGKEGGCYTPACDGRDSPAAAPEGVILDSCSDFPCVSRGGSNGADIDTPGCR